MDEAHKAVLRKHTVTFVNDLDLESVLDFLSGRQTITGAQYEELMPENGRERRKLVRQFLGTIMQRGPSAFNDFIDALDNSGQVHLLQLVCPDRAASRGTTKVKGPTVVSAPADKGSTQDENDLIDVQVKPTSPDRVRELLRDNGVYKMTNPSRGKVIIINNEQFTEKTEGSKETPLPRRDGSTKDSMNVNSLFGSLHFDVRTHNNLTAQEMRDLIKNETEDEEHQGLGMFVLVILSHGQQGGVYGVDGQLLPISEIKGLLSASHFPHMAGKPKLILLQACQGAKHDGRVEDDGPLETDALPPGAAQGRPGLSDMLIAFPTSEGHVSYRDTELGSWFIRAVVIVFMRKAYTDHVLDMLTEVRRLVCEKSTAAGYRQGTYDENHLHKKLYLLPGWTESS